MAVVPCRVKPGQSGCSLNLPNQSPKRMRSFWNYAVALVIPKLTKLTKLTREKLQSVTLA